MVFAAFAPFRAGAFSAPRILLSSPPNPRPPSSSPVGWWGWACGGGCTRPATGRVPGLMWLHRRRRRPALAAPARTGSDPPGFVESCFGPAGRQDLSCENSKMCGGPMTETCMRRILAAVDFSPVAERVVALASSLAEAYSAELFLIHIAAPEPRLRRLRARSRRGYAARRALTLRSEHRRPPGEGRGTSPAGDRTRRRCSSRAAPSRSFSRRARDSRSTPSSSAHTAMGPCIARWSAQYHGGDDSRSPVSCPLWFRRSSMRRPDATARLSIRQD